MTPPLSLPANDTTEAHGAPLDVIAAGAGQVTLSMRLDELVAVLDRVVMGAGVRADVMAAVLRLECVAMAFARALDEGGAP